MNDLEKQNGHVILQEPKPKKKRFFMRLPQNVDVSDDRQLVKDLQKLQKTLGHKTVAQTLLFTARIYFKSQSKDELLP